MVARSEMVSLINLFRDKGQASTTDQFDGTTYWTDDQLQDILDEASIYIDEIPVNALKSDNTLYVTTLADYYRLDNNVSADTEATVTYNTLRNNITLSTGDEIETVSGYVYDLYQALEELWGRKAQQRANYIEFATGNNRMHLEQERMYCEAQRDYYHRKVIRRIGDKGDGRWTT